MNQDTLEFVVYVIHACAKKWNMPPAKVYRIIEEKGCVSQYLTPFYDILHTQGINYLVHDIEGYMENRGVAL